MVSHGWPDALARSGGADKALSAFTRLDLVGDTNAVRPQLISLENRVFLGGCVAAIRQHTWSAPGSCVWSCDKHYISFALDRRRDFVWASYVDSPGQAQSPVGRAMMVPAGRTVHTYGPEGTERSLSCLIEDALFEGILPNSSRWSDVALAEGLCLKGHDMQWLFYKIYQEIRHEQFCSTIVIESMIMTLAVQLARQLGLAPRDPAPQSGGLAPWKMRRIRDRIASDLPPPNVAELAELAEMSVRHLTRAFKVETGQTVAQYVKVALIERAQDLLAKDSTPIAEIAQSLGFASTNGFSLAFRRATGLRPSEVSRGQRA